VNRWATSSNNTLGIVQQPTHTFEPHNRIVIVGGRSMAGRVVRIQQDIGEALETYGTIMEMVSDAVHDKLLCTTMNILTWNDPEAIKAWAVGGFLTKLVRDSMNSLIFLH
jgi:hypothetical protein